MSSLLLESQVNSIQHLGLSYEFSRDPDLLAQYFVIREKIYVETFKIEDFSTHDDIYDEHEHTNILIVRDNDTVIGGSRLSIRYDHSPTILPMEGDDFVLENLFPELALHNKTYAEITRMVIEPEYRKGRDMAAYMFWIQFAKAVSENCEYMFSVTPILQCRNNRRHFGDLGYVMNTYEDLKVSDKEAYEGKRMYFAITDIKGKMPVLPNTVAAKEAELVT